MLSDNLNRPSHSSGQLDEPPNLSYQGLVAFIARHLPTFAAEQQAHTDPTQNENGLTQRLVNLLQARRNYEPFFFDKEHMETETKGNSPRADFAILTRREVRLAGQRQPERQVVMVFEAKRLDRQLPRQREREYVIGTSQNGGIERFRSQAHGRNVAQGGLIAYVQSDGFAYWEATVNDWIRALSHEAASGATPWQPTECLHAQPSATPTVARFTSTHPRALGQISLHHLWVNLM